MSAEYPGDSAILDAEEIVVTNEAGEWRVSWHQPPDPPHGTPHGANALCLTRDDEVVLISEDGVRFGWPGGRPEGTETWEETLRREIAEECCCQVTAAELLGFVQAQCTSGPEAGSTLVRSIWLAQVNVIGWKPEFETVGRRLVPRTELRTHLWMEDGFEPVYARALNEAGL